MAGEPLGTLKPNQLGFAELHGKDWGQHHCPNCSGQYFIVVAECGRGADGHMFLICRECKSPTRPMKIMKPQMSDHIAKNLGLYIPNSEAWRSDLVPVTLDFGDGEDVD